MSNKAFIQGKSNVFSPPAALAGLSVREIFETDVEYWDSSRQESASH